ncbi:MAG: hypothetical protein K6L76_13970 [Agarilytica sp.]
MRFQRVLAFGVLSGAMIFFSACGSAPVKEESVISVSSAQIQQMSSYSELLSLYKSTSTALQGKDAALFASDFATLKQMGDKLVELRVAELKGSFDTARLESGQVPNKVLAGPKAEAQNPPTPAAQWKPVSDLVKDESDKTDAAIAEKTKQLDAPGLSDELRLVTMDDLHRLSGDQSWLVRRNEFVDKLIEEIRQAREAGTLTADLQPKIELILENRADDAALKDEFISVSAEIYQSDYFKALGNGLADKAFKVFIKMTESRNFDSIKEKLAPVSQNMVDYFIAEADESVKDAKNLSQSYRWFNQARVVSKALGFKRKSHQGHEVLVEQLNDKYEDLVEDGAHTIAFAYLHYIKEFRPLYKGLRQKMSQTEEKVQSLAVKRLSTTAFQGAQGYGDVISSKVTQHLFKHVANDVRIVEREKYEEIQRERAISGNSEGLSAVNLIVTGSILEAKVDETKQEGKKTVRAVVGQETITNTAYIKWLELPAKERKNIEKPSETLSVDKEENIPVKVTNHRKVGIFSVSYRLLDASSGRVLFPHSITKEDEHKGTSREGVEMGDFKLPFELADLPSDVKILDSLANLVSLEIGEKLVEKLKDQEKRYLAEAEDFEKDDTCSLQADRLAKAYVILNAKGLETKEVFEKYKDATINCDTI